MVSLSRAPPCRLIMVFFSKQKTAYEMRTGARAMSMAPLAAAHRAHLPHMGARLIGVVAEVGLALGPGQIFVGVAGDIAGRLPAQRAQPADIGQDVARVAEAVFAGDLRLAAGAGPPGHALGQL